MGAIYAPVMYTLNFILVLHLNDKQGACQYPDSFREAPRRLAHSTCAGHNRSLSYPLQTVILDMRQLS